MLQRLIGYWVYGGALAGVLLLLLVPLLTGNWPLALVAVFLHLPAYMLHQLEEHDNDRFRQFVNTVVGKGREVLSPGAVFIVNVPGVWGVNALSIYLAAMVNIGFGLIAVYLVLVNALVHMIEGAALRRYNPGLGSGIFLFLPLGGITLWLIQQSGGGSILYHAIGLFSALAIHAAILVHVRLQLSRP